MAVGMKGTIRRSNLVSGMLRVKHAEAVVMLGGKDQVLKAVAFCHLRPLFGLNTHRVKAAVQIHILCAEGILILLPVYILTRPVGVLLRKRPRLANAHLRIPPEVHHQRKLMIPKPFLPLLNQFTLWEDIFILLAAAAHALNNQISYVDFLRL